MNYINKYIDEMVSIIHRMYPDKDLDKVKKIIKNQVEKRLVNPIVNLDNNVTHENVDSDLLSVLKWIDNRKPVVSGNATFYKQPKEELSPTSNMLRGLKLERKKIKKQMFSYKPTDDEYGLLDLDQQNIKVVTNADYGGSGTKTAAFYTKWNPPATTLIAQSIITTMANLFESVIGDNNKFMSISECFDYMEIILSKINKDTKLPKWIHIPNREDLKRRMKLHFYKYSNEYSKPINDYVDHVNDTELVYLYYAHNLHQFILDHDKISKEFIYILQTLPLNPYPDHIPEEYKDKFESLDKYCKYIQQEMFMNPYVHPESINDNLNKISDLLMEYVYVPYLTPDSIEKLNHHKRKTVMLVDTDSNVLYLDLFCKFIKHEICHDQTFGRAEIYNDLIIINIAASFLANMVESHLNLYGLKHNMDDESRAELTMKNEFLFRTLMLLNAKKSYLASIILREGNLFNPYKTEIKGVQFIKSAVSLTVSKRFEKIASDNILFSEEINLKGLIKDVREFEKEIIEGMRQGDTTYLKIAELKEENSYKNKWSIQIFKAATVWNTIYPEDIIYPFDKAFIVKMGIHTISDLDPIKDKFPDIYDKIIKDIFNSPDDNIRKYGLSVIAVPSKYDKLPEWITILMDVELLCSNIMDSFKMILDSFRTEYITINTPSKKVERYTNLIKF